MSYQDDNDRDRYDDRYQDDRDRYERERTGAPGYPGQPPTKGGCSKGCLWGAAGCGCLTMLLVLAIGFASWKFVDVVSKGMSTDPAVIRAATQEMADIQPPAGLEPKIKMDVLVAKVIMYQSNDGESSLSLLQISPQFAQKGQGKNRDFGEGFRKGFGDGGQGIKQQEMKIEKFETKEIKIRGAVSKVKFSEAKNADQDEYRIIEAEFQGKVGPVQLQLQLPLEKYDEAEVTKFLESIK